MQSSAPYVKTLPGFAFETEIKKYCTKKGVRILVEAAWSVAQVFYFAILNVLEGATMQYYCCTKKWQFSRGKHKIVWLLAKVETYYTK